MSTTPRPVDETLAREFGLNAEEYGRVLAIMGRTPSLTELGIFSVMWSEHCSYKSSRVWLRELPTTADWVVHGPGENAGVVDIGDGLTAIFKMESHNHPSFIEPYQGAATGVGGILRDIFTMNARPLAVMDSLRFGPLQQGEGKREKGENPNSTFHDYRLAPFADEPLVCVAFCKVSGTRSGSHRSFRLLPSPFSRLPA